MDEGGEAGRRDVGGGSRGELGEGVGEEMRAGDGMREGGKEGGRKGGREGRAAKWKEVRWQVGQQEESVRGLCNRKR